MSSTPLWLDDAPAPRAPLVRDLDTRVCIVGAGVTGLATAWHLVQRGIRATLVDGRTVAGGASGRNGGFVTAGPAPAYHEAVQRWGRASAQRIQAATVDAREQVLRLAAEIGADAALRRSGSLRVALDEVEAADVRAELAALLADGFAASGVGEADLPAALRGPGRHGMFVPDDVLMHPARWYRALAAQLEREGVAIFEHTPVSAPLGERDGRALVLRAPGARIRAEVVVAAADGALASLVPAAAAGVRCRRLHAIASAPVERQVLPCGVGWRSGYEYCQQLPDGRIVLGGFSDLDGAASYTDHELASQPVHERIERELRFRLGVLEPVTHRWVGLVGYGPDERPRVGPVESEPGLFAAGGYNGSGNLNGWVAGRILAELIADGVSQDADLYGHAGYDPIPRTEGVTRSAAG